MRKLIKITLTALGIYAFLRWRKRRKAEAELPPAASTSMPAADPADELRQKLAESRVDEPDDEPASESVEDRRAEVHEQGRAALDEMKPSDEG